MKLLLDTHVWVWSVSDPEQLASEAREAIESGEHTLHVSSISYWEVAMMAERKALIIDGDFDSWLAHATHEYPVVELSVDRAIAIESRRVPLVHRDPADRFLAATAVVHDLTLVTRDRRLIDADGIPTLQA